MPIAFNVRGSGVVAPNVGADTVTTDSVTPANNALVFGAMAIRFYAPPSNPGDNVWTLDASGQSGTEVEILDQQYGSQRTMCVYHMQDASWSSGTFVFTSTSNRNLDATKTAAWLILEVTGITTGGTGGGDGLSNETISEVVDVSSLGVTIPGTPGDDDFTLAFIATEDDAVSVDPDANWTGTAKSFFTSSDNGMASYYSTSADQSPLFTFNSDTTAQDAIAVAMIIIAAAGAASPKLLTLLGVGS